MAKAKAKRRRKLSAGEVRRQHAAELPEREAMSLVVPSTSGLPLVQADPTASDPTLNAGAAGATEGGVSADVYAPQNKAATLNLFSPGSAESSSSTQNAPSTQTT